MLLLKRFPLPPSSNQLYASVNGRLIKSTEGRKYDSLIDGYKLREFRILEQFKETVKPTDLFNVDMHFIFMRDRLISKKDTIKRLDSTNRLKAAHDGLSKILDIDDCRFVTGSFSKNSCRFPHEEQVIITVKRSVLLTLDERLDLVIKGI